MLRHILATLAYRGGKTLRGAPTEFADFKGGTRTPAQILSHIGDLLDWALAQADGKQDWKERPPVPWDENVARFFASLKALDERLATDAPLGFPKERIFQGALADALTHVGQLAMLRRMAGCPMKGENYFKADIVAGSVGPEQAPPRREFD